MPCRACGADDGLTRQCTYCGQTYCTNHRLPEKHNCPSLTLADDETLDDIGKQTLTELRHVAERTESDESDQSSVDDAPLNLTDEQLQQLQEVREKSPDEPAKHHREETEETGGLLERIRSVIPFLG